MSTRSALAPLVTSLLVCVCVPLLWASQALGVVNGTPIPCEDRRFDAVGLVLNAGAWSCGGFIAGSCVLIQPDCALIARHSLDITTFQPLPNPATTPFRIRFRRAADGKAVNTYFFNGTPCHDMYQELRVTRLVDAAQTGTDMVLAYLERPVVGIKPIGLEINAAPRAGTPIIIAGWGYAGQCFQTGEFASLRYARGVLPSNILDQYFNYTPCSVGSVAPCLNCPQGGPWVNANLHDSGGGVFYEVPGVNPREPELRLLGSIFSLAGAQRPSLWNQAGGQPRLTQAVPQTLRDAADFNRDQLVDTKDIFDFLGAFFANDCIADTNRSGMVAADDLYTYLQMYFNAL